MLSEGQNIGPYELQRKLGAGTFGEVWLARHLDLDVVRAMKIPTDPEYVKQLRKEGRIQFGLKHPNIVETIELNTRHEPPYFVMAYVGTDDLRKRVKDRGKLPLAEALGIVSQVLSALEAAHAEGIIHRDLKPENILLAPDGTAKVTDFGLGQVQVEVVQSILLSGSMMTVSGQSVSGTYAYMSPEQQSGAQADPRDDIYSVGIMACELLTGRRPSAAGVERTMHREGVPEAVARVVVNACDEIGYRYPTAKAMSEAIRELGVVKQTGGITETVWTMTELDGKEAAPPPPPRRKREKEEEAFIPLDDKVALPPSSRSTRKPRPRGEPRRKPKPKPRPKPRAKPKPPHPPPVAMPVPDQDQWVELEPAATGAPAAEAGAENIHPGLRILVVAGCVIGMLMPDIAGHTPFGLGMLVRVWMVAVCPMIAIIAAIRSGKIAKSVFAGLVLQTSIYLRMQEQGFPTSQWLAFLGYTAVLVWIVGAIARSITRQRSPG